MKKRLFASLVVVLLIVLGVISAGAAAAPSGGCVSSTTLAHTVAGDETAASTIAAAKATACPVSVTTRLRSGTARTSWTTLVDERFSREPNGSWPAGWCKYAGKDHVYRQGYYDPAHAYVRGGLLHLLSSYQSSGPHGAAWYTGGFRIFGTSSCPAGAGPYPDSALNGRITVKMRLIESGTAARGHRNVVFWPDSGTYYQGGEEDMWESDRALNNASLFLHYDNNGSPAQLSRRYPARFDWSQWHTFRFQRLNDVISIYVDDMKTPIETYRGNSTTLPKTDKTWCFQQQMHNPSGTPPHRSDREDWQIASLVVQKMKDTQWLKLSVLRRGSKIYFKGRLLPKRRHRGIAIQMRVGGRWKTLARMRTSRHSTFKAVRTLKRSHSYKFRATTRGYPGLLGAKSRTVRIRN